MSGVSPLNWILPNFTSPPKVLAEFTLAPLARRKRTAPRLQFMAALWSGVKPSPSAASGGAPAAISTRMVSNWPASAASRTAVVPWLSLAFTWAPWWRRRRTVSVHPSHHAATIRGVRPSLEAAFTSAPFSINRAALRGSPAPHSNAVASRPFFALTSAPASNSSFHGVRAAEGRGVHQQGRAAPVAGVHVDALGKLRFQGRQVVFANGLEQVVGRILAARGSAEKQQRRRDSSDSPHQVLSSRQDCLDPSDPRVGRLTHGRRPVSESCSPTTRNRATEMDHAGLVK